MKSINIKAIEDAIKELTIKVDHKADKKDLDALAELLKKLQAELEKLGQTSATHTSEINGLKSRLELLESKFAQISKSVSELFTRFEKLKGMADRPIAAGGNSNIDEGEWSEMKKAVEKLKKDVSDIFKELEMLKDIRRKITLLEGALEGKLDKEEFEKWKAESDINQILSGLLKKFADRNEMLKALKKLEQRISILEELIKETGGGMMDHEDNAMLAKKPLGGWSCASCQKDLINIEGTRVPYNPWAKLPQRNPTERIAKVGQGFSRMLSMLKPELITKSQQVGVMQKKYYEEDPRATMGEDQMAKSHAVGFAQPQLDKRPNTANVFPHIQQQKVFFKNL